jgi:hypothetical protein
MRPVQNRDAYTLDRFPLRCSASIDACDVGECLVLGNAMRTRLRDDVQLWGVPKGGSCHWSGS